MIKKGWILFLIVSCVFCVCGVNKAEDLKKQAENAIHNKQYTRAIEYLDQAIRQNPDDQELHYFRGQALRSLLHDDGADINKANLQVAQKASAAFQRVIEINPRYDGKKFVVDPYTKIQGIWGSVATTYTVDHKLDSAKWAFNKGKTAGAFYPAIVEYNRNIMASCEKNAILFTNGDNDTYPMWYLQMMQNYRPDITVVNLSLLNVDWYIRQLREDYPYGTNNLECITDVQLDDVKPQKWQSTEISLPAQSSSEETVKWMLNPTIEDKMIRTQDMMVVEILKRNYWKRPVYFSTTVYSGNKIGIDEYLSFEGLVLRVVSEKNGSSVSNLHNNLIENYTYKGIKDDHLEYIDEVKQLYSNYDVAFERLSTLHIEKGNEKEAQKVREFMKKIPLPQ
jgi:tetratricopeptide (TPR) repeat protein